MTAARPALISVADALRSKHLYGPHFEGESWSTWRAVLKAGFAEPLSKSELATFHEVAERPPPRHRVDCLTCIVGRGGGKDATASFVAAYIAMSFNPKAAKLRAGELAFIMCLATDKDQAAIAYRYIRALFEDIPTLRRMVKSINSDSIELVNKVVIQVIVNSYRAIRGRSVLAAIFDEAGYWRSDESQNPDVEVYSALAPGLARVKGSVLVIISSAYRRAGLLYEKWKASYGRPDDGTLVVRGTTRQFNPLFDRAVIDKALASDLARASAEYLSEWRDDLSTFISRELLESCVERGVTVRPPIANVTYAAFTDSSGARGDSFTAAVAHRELHNGRERTVTDCVYERRPPFNPSEVIEEISRLLKSYRCGAVSGDNYAAEFVVEAFRKCGIRYAASKLDRSEIYLGFLPLIASGQVLLLDHPRAIAQFANLERRTFPSGKDRVDHGQGGHDDLANSIAGAVTLASVDREQHISFAAPCIIHKDGTSSWDHLLARSGDRAGVAGSSTLDEKKHTLAGRRASLQRELDRCFDAALADPVAREKRDRLLAEQAAVTDELKQVNSAMAKRLADQPDATELWYLNGGGAGSQLGGLYWGPVETRGKIP